MVVGYSYLPICGRVRLRCLLLYQKTPKTTIRIPSITARITNPISEALGPFNFGDSAEPEAPLDGDDDPDEVGLGLGELDSDVCCGYI